MLSYSAITANGDTITLSTPSSLIIQKETDVPADMLTALFPTEIALPELQMLTVSDGDTTVFTGIVDEQDMASAISGSFVKVVARSLAALLLDNEALPQNYINPTIEVIFDRHIRDYGLAGFISDKPASEGTLSVTKGVTEWYVLNSFCKNFLNTTPRITENGMVDVSESAQKNAVLFNNNGSEIQYFISNVSIKRNKLISQVLVRTDLKSGYTFSVFNKDAVTRGVKRKRYLNAVGDNYGMIQTADKIMDIGNEDSFDLTIVCPCMIVNCLGSKAVLEDSTDYQNENLYVNKIEYILNQNQEKTTIHLVRKAESSYVAT
ncbi:MAG: hypothetical protein Q8876_00140 [Bacillota bacterium]|nr:hypothetical protein [Bacillota bacterium]